jgi:hypothetical protein
MDKKIDEGVVISQREIYDLLLDLRDSVIVIQQDMKYLKATAPDCEARKEMCDKRFDELRSEQDKMSGLKVQVNIMWGFVSAIIMSLIAVGLKVFERGAAQ